MKIYNRGVAFPFLNLDRGGPGSTVVDVEAGKSIVCDGSQTPAELEFTHGKFNAIVGNGHAVYKVIKLVRMHMSTGCVEVK